MKEKIKETLKKVLNGILGDSNDLQFQPVPVRVNNRFGRQ